MQQKLASLDDDNAAIDNILRQRGKKSKKTAEEPVVDNGSHKLGSAVESVKNRSAKKVNFS